MYFNIIVRQSMSRFPARRDFRYTGRDVNRFCILAHNAT